MSETSFDRLPWLHIYGQYIYHGPATIKGTRDGLTALRDAITKALECGEETAEAFASDGEGYGVNILRVNTHASLGDPEYIYEAEFRVGIRAAEREREIRKVRKARKPPTHKQEPPALTEGERT